MQSITNSGNLDQNKKNIIVINQLDDDRIKEFLPLIEGITFLILAVIFSLINWRISPLTKIEINLTGNSLILFSFCLIMACIIYTFETLIFKFFKLKKNWQTGDFLIKEFERFDSLFRDILTLLLVTLLAIVYPSIQLIPITICLTVFVQEISKFYGYYFRTVSTEFFISDNKLVARTIEKFPYPLLFYKRELYWFPNNDGALEFAIIEDKNKKFSKNRLFKLLKLSDVNFLTLPEADKVNEEKRNSIFRIFLVNSNNSNEIPAYIIGFNLSYYKIKEFFSTLESNGKITVTKNYNSIKI